MRQFKIGIFYIALLIFLTGCKEKESQYTAKKAEYDCTIGLIFHDTENMLSAAIVDYVNYIEENYNVKFLYSSSLDHLEAVRDLCANGADVIMTANTSNVPKAVLLCEEYETYFLQMLDKPSDTDITAKYENNPYYLGAIICDEEKVCKNMAESIMSKGYERIGLISVAPNLNIAQVHVERRILLQDFIIEQNEDAVEFITYTLNSKDAIANVAAQNFIPDSLITTLSSFDYTVEELKEMFHNNSLKFMYFDLNENTRQELLAGDTLMVSCGQHAVIPLAFAYAYYIATTQYIPDQKLALALEYITLSSAEEYDLYITHFIEQMPYGAVEIDEMIAGLHHGIDILKQYAENYSLPYVIERKENTQE